MEIVESKILNINVNKVRRRNMSDNLDKSYVDVKEVTVATEYFAINLMNFI
jgi:hypothetical protein